MSGGLGFTANVEEVRHGGWHPKGEFVVCDDGFDAIAWTEASEHGVVQGSQEIGLGLLQVRAGLGFGPDWRAALWCRAGRVCWGLPFLVRAFQPLLRCRRGWFPLPDAESENDAVICCWDTARWPWGWIDCSFLIGAGEYKLAAHRFDRLAAADKLGCEKVRQIMVGRGLSHATKIIRGSDDDFSKMVLPDTVGDDSGDKRV
ncbi:MAG: hypothetical protein M2R45_02063 [Verrucomicrobia subdivision 3 bacterium]|nr:hypothetical protein [Limisphaerales bacterium]MCS1414882.1 hypothetical protein [Limisphaerales bacterium]